ncbi:hypothetical protein CSUB01_00701 [Colletotrichum sublineola]|uniref:tRNA (uracil(54)-C(5))-methyltransferase n=1 Tax=Colletotrichum sublineola TaxID=1173701 RepID=A0A066XJ20_COLSU|nr:hypothetical protein CSUB01_00701 [Colletotrichum sublineola]
MSSNQDTPQSQAASKPAQEAPPKPTAPAASQQGQEQGKGSGQKTWQNNGNRPNGNKRGFQGQGGRGKDKQRKSKRERNITEGSSEEVLAADVQALIESRKASLPEPAEAATETDAEAKEGDAEAETAATPPSQPLPAPFTEIEVEVLALSSTGDGLAVHAGSPPTQIYVVPFVAPGDVARVKVVRHVPAESYSMADFLSVTTPGPLRDDTRVNCKYFTRCSGCQFQMLSYDTQLAHKRTIVEKAYRNFSNLDPALVPEVAETIGSPLQYGYRTKLTPHFDGPPGHHKKNRPRQALDRVPEVGFNLKGRRAVLDIEDCPIGTDAELPPAETPSDAIRVDTDTHTDIKTCLSEASAMTTEYIGPYVFTNPANSFFQNNNAILPSFTAYIRDHVMPPAGPHRDRIKYLIDAYSGSGLFTITLASLFRGSTGIDIARDSIECARKNARLNGLPESQCNFLAADAPQLFAHVTYPADETVVVIDPPRKGCDADFLGQLLRFGPRRVVYVSCNVHTQARDVGVLVRGDGGDGTRYEIESLVGFDFFPQTGHVEGVAVLNRVEKTA